MYSHVSSRGIGNNGKLDLSFWELAFTQLYSVVTWIMSLICTNLTMILSVTWFIYGVF